MAESSVLGGDYDCVPVRVNNVIDYGQYKQYPSTSGETTVEEIEYDEKGRIKKRTITKTGTPSYPWTTQPNTPWQPWITYC
jgi:hypothetical protein